MTTITLFRGSAAARSLRSFAVAITIIALSFSLSACGGGGGYSRDSGYRGGGPGATAAMPGHASSKARNHAANCDGGNMKSCNWVGIWFLVGGAGKGRKAEGVRYLKYACNNGYQPSCKLINALRKKLQQQQRRGR